MTVNVDPVLEILCQVCCVPDVLEELTAFVFSIELSSERVFRLLDRVIFLFNFFCDSLLGHVQPEGVDFLHFTIKIYSLHHVLLACGPTLALKGRVLVFMLITSFVLDQPMAALPNYFLFILTFIMKMEAVQTSEMLATQLTASWYTDAKTDTALSYIYVT